MTHRFPSILRLALCGAAILSVVGLTACSSEKAGSTPTTLLVPAQWIVLRHDAAEVYDLSTAALADAGLTADPGYSFKVNGTWTSKRVRCSPNGQERHVAWCVFRLTVNPVPDFNAPPPEQVAVRVKVSTPDRVEYDKEAALQQIRIEPTLEKITAKLSARYYGDAQAPQNEQLTF